MQPFEMSHKGPLRMWPPNNKAFKVYSGLGHFWGALSKTILINVMIFISCLACVENCNVSFSPSSGEFGLVRSLSGIGHNVIVIQFLLKESSIDTVDGVKL